MNYNIGETLYDCSRWDDRRYHIGIVHVIDAKHITDSKKRNLGISYLLKAENFRYAGKTEFAKKEGQIEANFYRSAVEAVSAALKQFFRTLDKPAPEAMLLASMFGNKPNVEITIEELPKVIRELKDFQKLFAEASAKDLETNAETIGREG